MGGLNGAGEVAKTVYAAEIQRLWTHSPDVDPRESLEPIARQNGLTARRDGIKKE